MKWHYSCGGGLGSRRSPLTRHLISNFVRFSRTSKGTESSWSAIVVRLHSGRFRMAQLMLVASSSQISPHPHHRKAHDRHLQAAAPDLFSTYGNGDVELASRLGGLLGCLGVAPVTHASHPLRQCPFVEGVSDGATPLPIQPLTTQYSSRRLTTVLAAACRNHSCQSSGRIRLQSKSILNSWVVGQFTAALIGSDLSTPDLPVASETNSMLAPPFSSFG